MATQLENNARYLNTLCSVHVTHKVKHWSRNNSATDCSIAFRFYTEFHYVTDDMLQMFKVSGQVYSIKQTWIQDLLIQDQESAVSRPRLSSSKTKTKTLMSKTKNETQDLRYQYWTSMTGMDCDKQKGWKSLVSRKSSIPVVAHSKQQNIIPCLTTVLFWQLPLIIAVYQTSARTRNILKVQCFIDN